jgi:hypothetical protein
MLEVFYKNCRILFYLCSLTSVFLHAQDKKDISNIEKVYLHTDRNTYFIGEDLWYKAYNVRAVNNLLFDNSNILYVELISSEAKMIARNKTQLALGLGHGDFQLVDSINVKPGKYQLRAYTNWNRNFGEDFVFKKDIEIIDVFESKENIKVFKKSVLETKTTKNKTNSKKSFNVDFFPEGGSLLENVTSVVGFKAVDLNGKPIDIKGGIYDSANELVTIFESVHDGMGKLQMLPIEGKRYYAKIKNPRGEELQVELPKILKQGYSLAFRTFKGKNIVSINTNEATLQQNPNAKLTVGFKSKGISYLETTQTLVETSLSFELPKDKFSEGISQITIYDRNNKPQSERLIYIEREQNLEVQIVTDKTTYQPDEKVTLDVSSKSKDGTTKSASFSLSVTDTNGVEDNNDDSNICSYFLMESDIRGKVNHPAYYFDANNPKRLEYLDNLLLTQGWRDFLWKTLPTSKTEFKVEKGITISGRVKQVFADKPLVKNNLTLSLMNKKNRNFFSAITDSIGRFEFNNLVFSGKTNMYLNSVNEKGKFRGEIVLDSIELAPMLVSFKKESIVLEQVNNSFTENVLKKFTVFGVKPENVLNEVVVKAKNKHWQPVYYKNPFSTYTPDVVTKTLVSIWDVLKIVPGIWVKDRFDRDVRVVGEKSVPSILVNGSGVSNHDLDYILPNEIVKIEVVRELGVPIISIFINRNWNDHPKKVPVYAVKQEIEGFYSARTFYSPNPEKSNADLDEKAAVRNTIYWNPYVHPDKSGNSTVNYFNNSVETKVKVNLEGITSNGIPVVKNIYYAIKK